MGCALIGGIITITLFPLVGLAVQRIAGRASPFIAGAGMVGTVMFFAGLARVNFLVTIGALAAISLIVLWVTPPPAGVRLFTGWPVVPSLVGLCVAMWLLIVTAIVPLNDYDGRAFWVLKAKAIAHEGSIDGPYFQGRTAVNPRNQYPLLVPIDVAVIFALAHDIDDRQARWFYACVLIAFALEVAVQCGVWLGLAVLLLPQLLVNGDGGAVSAYSDLSLAAFAACAFFELRGNGSPSRLGMWLAFMLLTKNEGLPFAVLLLAMSVPLFGRRVWRALLPFVIVLGALQLWRTRVGPSDENDFLHMITAVGAHLDRFAVALADFARQSVAFDRWGLFWLATIFAVVLLVVRRRWRAAALAGVATVPMIFLFAGVFAVTDWQRIVLTENLAPRLLTHLLGPALFVLSEAMRPRDLQ